ncbi:aliphatic sulfonate ABC transporter substrate-binding protein [Actinotalea fermentans]|uniref:Putative aliphatic sulfonates-binding protein n=1 Tax=Actinotalea fermentans TaxID=43671 RepID=A0A511YW52_9CELL|nr:aliphatic sulfonate ABC transporter substrate-binding protein [Actinotalea fermentans]KGM17414.1 ABC transporter substrate-binding protein [Actinotalea fermentans ATCC 43279 = JCM 9966 = DSM 3133]GEN79412.1 ABC transporter substrate-binding protein [Actinotalea fermentans]
MRIRTALSVTATLSAALMLGGCLAGESGSAQSAPTADAAGATAGTEDDAQWSADALNIDFATYNPLSLIIKEQGWLEAELEGVTVTWTQSAGSNKANEALRASAIDVGSTAGSAALLASANGSPIQTVEIYTQPEWAAIVVPADSDIDSVEDLRGRSVAATKGTDPYFFLLQALEAHGVGLDEVEVQNVQHADGRVALENGSVDAWSGLDPIMADSEVNAGSRLIYRNIDFNSYGFLNVREEYLQAHPDVVQAVVDAYEKARAWALANPEETAAILADVAGIDLAIAEKVILERTVIDLDPVPGEAQRAVLEVVGPIFVESGDVSSQAQIDDALDALFDPSFATQADPSRIDD